MLTSLQYTLCYACEMEKGLIRRQKEETCYETLVRSIISQQLAVKAAAAIHNRFVMLCHERQKKEGKSRIKGKARGKESGRDSDQIITTINRILPETVLYKLDIEEMKSVGLSTSKATYIQNLSRSFVTSQEDNNDGSKGKKRKGSESKGKEESTEISLTDKICFELDDEDLHRRLTAIKGIGPWTVNMFQMFHLRRPNILPVGDLGVRKGFQKVYNLRGLPNKEEMEKISANWEPYRSIGVYYMWRALSSDSTSNSNDKKENKEEEVPMIATPDKLTANEKRKQNRATRPGGGCPWLDGANAVDVTRLPKKSKHNS